MHFNTYLEKARQLNEFAIDSSWGQGRTIFGGLSAGILYEKMSVLVPQEFTIKFMNLCYSSPLQANIAISLEAELVSSGKSTYQVQAKLRQNQKICVLATSTFGKARESRISHHSKRADLKPHKKLKDISSSNISVAESSAAEDKGIGANTTQYMSCNSSFVNNPEP